MSSTVMSVSGAGPVLLVVGCCCTEERSCTMLPGSWYPVCCTCMSVLAS